MCTCNAASWLLSLHNCGTSTRCCKHNGDIESRKRCFYYYGVCCILFLRPLRITVEREGPCTMDYPPTPWFSLDSFWGLKLIWKSLPRPGNEARKSVNTYAPSMHTSSTEFSLLITHGNHSKQLTTNGTCHQPNTNPTHPHTCCSVPNELTWSQKRATPCFHQNIS